jgi:hypothetical protein
MNAKLILTLIGAFLTNMSFSQAPKQESASNVVFESGFEEGNKLIWDDYDGNPDSQNQLISDPGPFNTPGNHVIRLRVPSGKRGGSDLVKVLPEQYDSLYARWYIMYEPGFNFNAPNHGGGLFAGDRNFLGTSGNRPNGDDWAQIWLEYNNKSHTPYFYVYSVGMYQDCKDPAGSCWGDHFPCTADEGKTYCKQEQHRDPPMPPTLTTGKWYRMEMRFNLGTPSVDGSIRDGKIALWVDGINYGQWDDLWLRTTSDLKISLLTLALFHHDGTHSDEGVLIDDVVVSKSREISTSALDIKKTGDLLRIYPNPSDPEDSGVKVSLPEYRDYSIKLYDMMGRLLISKSVAGNESSLDIENLESGIYNVLIKDSHSNAVIGTRKLVCR